MNGSAVKKLRERVNSIGARLSNGAWRGLKRAYQETPRNERHKFDLHGALNQLRVRYAQRHAKVAAEHAKKLEKENPTLFRKLLKAATNK